MDTSPEFIKMCEKATEIQGINNYNMGSWFWESKMGELCILIYPHEKQQYSWKPWYEPSLVALSDHMLYAKDHHAVWLPRQDQLQEMIWDADWVVQSMRLWFYTQTVDTLDYWAQFKSWEQLWLAFIMREKYDKQWNGSDWVKQNAG